MYAIIKEILNQSREIAYAQMCGKKFLGIYMILKLCRPKSLILTL